VAQNGGFHWFDEVARHFESVVLEISPRSPELWMVSGEEGLVEHLGLNNWVGCYFSPVPTLKYIPQNMGVGATDWRSRVKVRSLQRLPFHRDVWDCCWKTPRDGHKED